MILKSLFRKYLKIETLNDKELSKICSDSIYLVLLKRLLTLSLELLKEMRNWLLSSRKLKSWKAPLGIFRYQPIYSNSIVTLHLFVRSWKSSLCPLLIPTVRFWDIWNIWVKRMGKEDLMWIFGERPPVSTIVLGPLKNISILISLACFLGLTRRMSVWWKFAQK